MHIILPFFAMFVCKLIYLRENSSLPLDLKTTNVDTKSFQHC